MIQHRDLSLDVLKGIGIITMVMAHCNMGNYFETYVAGFHMQLFFIVSGFLFTPGKYSFKTYLSRKLRTLMIPYVTFAILTLIYCGIVSLSLGENVYDFPECLLGIIFSNRSIFPITGALWFLQCIFIVDILFFCISLLNPKLQFILIVFFGIMGFMQSHFDIWLPFAMDSALSAIVLFYMGFFCRKYKMYIANQTHNLVIGLSFVLLTMATIFLNGSVNPRTCTYSNYLLYLFNSFTATLGYFFISRYLINNYSTVKYIAEIGKDSIVFVGCNQLVITILYQAILLILPIEDRFFRAVRNIIIFFFTLIVLKFATEKINNSKYKILIGK